MWLLLSQKHITTFSRDSKPETMGTAGHAHAHDELPIVAGRSADGSPCWIAFRIWVTSVMMKYHNQLQSDERSASHSRNRWIFGWVKIPGFNLMAQHPSMAGIPALRMTWHQKQSMLAVAKSSLSDDLLERNGHSPLSLRYWVIVQTTWSMQIVHEYNSTNPVGANQHGFVPHRFRIQRSQQYWPSDRRFYRSRQRSPQNPD